MKVTELKHVSVRYICKDAMLSIVYRLFFQDKSAVSYIYCLLPTSYYCECLQDKCRCFFPAVI